MKYFKTNYVEVCCKLDSLKKKRDELNRQIDSLERVKQEIIMKDVPRIYSNDASDRKPWEQPTVRFGG